MQTTVKAMTCVLIRRCLFARLISPDSCTRYLHPTHCYLRLVASMAQSMSALMSNLVLNAPPSPAGHYPTNNHIFSSNGNRLPPVLKKYMNPGLVRPPNTGLANHGTNPYGESQRGPLMKLAGVNVPTNSPARHSMLKPVRAGSTGKSHHKPSLSQHTAHGLHGPAHLTSSRALSSSINPHHATHPTAGGIRKVEIGKYDGGLEADEAGRDAVTGDSAKLLEMDSSAAG